MARDTEAGRHDAGREAGEGSDGPRVGAFVPLVVVIGLVAGVVATFAQSFPTGYVAAAYASGTALYAKLTRYRDVYDTDLWREARTDAAGAALCDPAAVQPGYTLFTSGDAPRATLLALDGSVVHEWDRPYSTVWDESAAVDEPQPDSHVYMRKAQVLPDGGLLAIYDGVGDTPYGYGMVRLDRDSNVVWKYLEHAHHDFDVADDGRVYALTHDIVTEPLEGYEGVAAPRLEDYLVVLSPDGRELVKVPLLKALLDSPYEPLIHQVAAYATGDPLHTNAVDVIDEAQAAAFPFGNAGDVMLSFRELGTIAVLDVDARRIVWATRGSWVGQHDPDILPGGNILLFDNVGRFGADGRSRVIEFDPSTLKIVWQFPEGDGGDLDSTLRSAQERLPNGNTLITESDGGRILEVTPQGKVAWIYVNDVRGGRGGSHIPVVSWAQRIDPAALDPDFRAALEARPAAASSAAAPTPNCGGRTDGAVRPAVIRTDVD